MFMHNEAFWKNYVKCEKTKTHQIFHNCRKRELFNIRIKLPYIILLFFQKIY